MVSPMMALVEQERFLEACRDGEVAVLIRPVVEFRPRKILVEVARKHGITTAEMLAKGSRRHYAARVETAKRLRDELGLSYPKIGMFLNRDHQPVYAMVNEGYRMRRAAQKRRAANGKADRRDHHGS